MTVFLPVRIERFNNLFIALQNTSSRMTKNDIIRQFKTAYPELTDDFNYIFETLSGMHPIGWTFTPRENQYIPAYASVRELIEQCERLTDHTTYSITACEYSIGMYGEFLAPIVNRTLRLGVSRSLLDKTSVAPMLAKKFTGSLRQPFVITEKLDGNRCIAEYDQTTESWRFYSRSGKVMSVDFDTRGLDKSCIYDGEVMSREQTRLSIARTYSLLNGREMSFDTKDAQLQFNQTSGLINAKNADKSSLVYNIFDIIDDALTYNTRRLILDENKADIETKNIRVLPALYRGDDISIVDRMLMGITSMGGEGVMLNQLYRSYENKRTDALLKYKQVKTIDMRVVSLYEGTGKYTGSVGGLHCELVTSDCKYISCDVGTGLSDAQREEWYVHPEEIVDHIVQIGYHELTQCLSTQNTDIYSLRFPRLLSVRTDKDTTSEY